MHYLLLLLLMGSISSLILILHNTSFIRSNHQKDYHQDNLSFVCLQFYRHDCLNILAGNICFHIQYTIFFLSGFSFTDTDDLQDSRGREGTIFYSTLPLPPAHNIETFICNFACEMTITYF